jgi:hypothetical protein
MKYSLGLFGHLEEWETSDRRSDRVDLRPVRRPGLARRRRSR